MEAIHIVVARDGSPKNGSLYDVAGEELRQTKMATKSDFILLYVSLNILPSFSQLKGQTTTSYSDCHLTFCPHG